MRSQIIRHFHAAATSASARETFSVVCSNGWSRRALRPAWLVASFAVDASLIQADANKQRSIAGQDWHKDRDPARSSRAVKEYLATLDDKAWGAASDVVPKFV